MTPLAHAAAADDATPVGDEKYLCVVPIKDAPGIKRIISPTASARTFARTFKVEPYFVASSADGLWSLGPDHRRHVLSAKWPAQLWPGRSNTRMTLDSPSGKILAASRLGLFRIESANEFVRIPRQGTAFKDTRAIEYIERLNKTFIATSTGLFGMLRRGRR